MITKTLYRIIRSDGGVDITPHKPTDEEYEETFRLISDVNMTLTDGINMFSCIDTDDPEKYYEIEYNEFSDEDSEN